MLDYAVRQSGIQLKGTIYIQKTTKQLETEQKKLGY